MKIKSVAHVCIRTKDLAATRKFYCDALGLEQGFNFMRKGSLHGFYLKAGNNTFIEFFETESAEHVDNRALHHFCLEVEDMKGAHARLREHGFSPGDIKMGADHTPQFWVKDPNGLDIEFHEYTPQSAQHTGEVVEVNW